MLKGMLVVALLLLTTVGLTVLINKIGLQPYRIAV